MSEEMNWIGKKKGIWFDQEMRRKVMRIGWERGMKTLKLKRDRYLKVEQSEFGNQHKNMNRARILQMIKIKYS